jgi:hypothetical protein
MNPHDPPSPHHGLAVPVDPARAEALRARLHEQLIGRTAPVPTLRPQAAERQELTVHTRPPESLARRIITIAAIAIAVGGLAGVAAIASREDAPSDDEQPATGASPSTTTPTTTADAPSTTATSTTATSTTATTAPPRLPLPDDEIAAAALPRRDGE